MMKEEELNLALRARAGDKDAFASLYDGYVKKIYDFIYYKTLHKDIAEDILSQVFLKALKSITSFKGDNFSSWLYAIARNTIIDHYRATKELKDIDDCWDLASDDDLIEDVDNNLKLRKIHELLRDLPANDRELLIMRLWLDMPFKEIAENLNKSEAAVKMSFGRTIERLRERMPLALFLLTSLSIICKKLN